MFHLVSLSLQISLADLPGPCLGLCVGVACFWLVLFLVGFFLPGKFDFNLMLIPNVDRPCLALVRQCRKKKTLHSSSATVAVPTPLFLCLNRRADGSPARRFHWNHLWENHV